MTVNAGMDVQEKEHLFILDGSTNWYDCYINQ